MTAFGVGMALGMATSNPAAKIVERDLVFVWSLLAAAGALIVMAAMPNLSWTVVFTVWLGAFCGLAWVSGYTLLQENVVDEFRGRTFAALTTLSRMVLFLSLALFPLLAQVFAWIAQALGGGDFYIGGQRIDLSGTRLALWTAGVRGFGWAMLAPIPAVIAAWPAGALAPTLSPPRFTRRDIAWVSLALLAVPAVGAVDGRRADHHRGAQHTPTAHAVPSVASRLPRPRAETQATARHRSLHRLRRRRRCGQGDADRDARGAPAGGSRARARDA